MEEPNFKFSDKDKRFFDAFLHFMINQKGIFCKQDIVVKSGLHRTEVGRMLDSQIRSGLIKPISHNNVKRFLKNKDKRFIYYKTDLSHPFANWWYDNKRAIAIDVLQSEFGDGAKPIIRKLKRKIKTKSIKDQLAS